MDRPASRVYEGRARGRLGLFIVARAALIAFGDVFLAMTFLGLSTLTDKEGQSMNETCFYCQCECDDNVHYVSFHTNGEEREEALCPECYQEWLQGMKG